MRKCHSIFVFITEYFQEIKKFLADPKPEAEEKPKETAWSDEPSEVVHLTDDTFDT